MKKLDTLEDLSNAIQELSEAVKENTEANQRLSSEFKEFKMKVEPIVAFFEGTKVANSIIRGAALTIISIGSIIGGLYALIRSAK